jgi:hypothetical protein
MVRAMQKLYNVAQSANWPEHGACGFGGIGSAYKRSQLAGSSGPSKIGHDVSFQLVSSFWSAAIFCTEVNFEYNKGGFQIKSTLSVSMQIISSSRCSASVAYEPAVDNLLVFSLVAAMKL